MDSVTERGARRRIIVPHRHVHRFPRWVHCGRGPNRRARGSPELRSLRISAGWPRSVGDDIRFPDLLPCLDVEGHDTPTELAALVLGIHRRAFFTGRYRDV